MIAFHTVVFSQNTGSVNGKVTDKQTREALPAATVTIKGVSSSVITNNEGYFVFPKLNAGKVILVISYVGYEALELPVIVTDENTTIADAGLTIDNRPGNEVVVSASKRAEKITNAPASIQVIGVKDLEQFSGSNVGELVSKVQGVEYTRSGVDEITFNARGFNSAFNIKVKV
jgi:iron complex outermembrane receptor protein